MGTQRHIIDPHGDTIITLRNPNAPFAVPSGNEDFYGSASIPKSGAKRKRKPTDDNGANPGEEPAASRARIEDGPSTAAEKRTQSVTKLPEVPEIDFQVSSAHLKLVSPYFRAALDGPFRESQQAADGLRHVEASGWDTNAILIVMRIIHGQNRFVPGQLQPEMRAKVAVIVDYYQCREALVAFVELWRLSLGDYLTPTMPGRDLVMALLPCWVFRWADEFKKVSEQLMLRSRKPINPQGLPIPESILLTIERKRRNSAIEMTQTIDRLLECFRREPPICSFECASTKLGALERELLHKEELQFYEKEDKKYVGYSITASIKAMREIRCPNCANYSRCTGGKSVEIEVAKLGAPAGLDLQTFVQPTQGYIGNVEFVEPSGLW
ncbi:hypothetical protein SAMD00023353_5000020 [Rosellinia necatrix]|uniref:BTB domain-containing protein n=1 Tax=Rosellinia necatrix TaxID=77044 RepID=A0A1W2TQ23_ROSNE|nr:hypothetical protein SAMD00023353_5000020 [Rosellinia necatrix]